MENPDIYNLRTTIKNKDDFLIFLSALNQDFMKNNAEWENITIDSFLEAMHSWIESMENYYKNTDQDIKNIPMWRLFADILLASRIYE